MMPLSFGKAACSGQAGLVSLLILSVACGRTGVGPLKPDGGKRIPDGAVAEIPDGAAAGTPDRAQIWIPDAAKTVDAPAVCQVPPAPACVPGPAQEVALTTLGYRDIMGLGPAGEEVFFATRDNDNRTPAGRISRLTLATRQEQGFDLSGIPGLFHYQAGAAVYRPAFAHPTDPNGSLASDVVRWDLQTGTRSELPRLTGFQNPSVESLAVNARGEVFWCLKEGARDTIAKWSPCTQRTTVLAEGRNTLFLYADETTVYWQEVERDEAGPSPSRALIYSMPTVGGAATLLVAVPTDTWNGIVLHGIDEQRLYYLQAEVGLMAIPKQGGEAQLVIAKPWPWRWAFDETHIYWVEFTQQSTLRRTPKQGGPTEVLWTNPSDGQIQAVAVDACNVYWFAVNPQTLRYRAK